MAAPNKTDVFQFMSVRSPQTVEPAKLRRFYIQDDYIETTSEDKVEISARRLREIFSANSEWEIGKIIFHKIFCEHADTVKQTNDEIISAVLDSIVSRTIYCKETPNALPDNLVNELEQNPYLISDNNYFLLPARLEYLTDNKDLANDCINAGNIVEKYIYKFDKTALIEELEEAFGEVFDLYPTHKLLFPKVFTVEMPTRDPVRNYNWKFQNLKNTLFETLYKLYILRRLTSINLEYIIKGLQILRVIEILAVDEFLSLVKSRQLDVSESLIERFVLFFRHLFPELKDVTFPAISDDDFFIKDGNDLINYFESTPVIHPIVAKLGWYKQPFNDIKPIGIGDLKVVKQWLCGYKAGEFSDVHNIMKGESKDRTHRHLEKTEEVFSFSSESSDDSQKESQTTDRFEVKKEAEKVIKSDINVGANTNFTYKNDAYGITASVGGNFAYTNSNQDTQKTASNYARDVMDKAVTQVQNRSTQNRSITKIYETEETNKHSFTNIQPGATHTSGIYRWLDKKYKAQLYNYGKRLMFEFIIPEPAAFYVESKLRVAEFDIPVPQKPEVEYENVKILNPVQPHSELAPEAIDQDIFNSLRQKYDLDEFTYPAEKIEQSFTDQLTGNSNLFVNIGSDGKGHWKAYQYTGKIEEKGYNIIGFKTYGLVVFASPGPVNEPIDNNDNEQENRIVTVINGKTAVIERNLKGDHIYYDKVFTPQVLNSMTFNATSGEVTIDLGFNNSQWFSLQFILHLKLDDNFKLDWQTKVYNRIKSIEQKKVDKINQELEIVFNAKMSDYNNKLNELNAQIVNDIIQGRSEAFNRDIIRQELKKHCLTMIMKEFDTDNSTDIISNKDALGYQPTNIKYDRFKITEDVAVSSRPNTIPKTKTVAEFIEDEKVVYYPKIDIDKTKEKARYIQFLEQCFEWEQIAYIFYPYFWASENKWIKLMNRLDYTDNNMTAFLKAGSVRVLIAATPHYNDAVMHFLATREPWEGGPLPVIGDSLFIPIYEEIRKQQDDLQNATPEGESWEFEVPTSLVYLQDSSSPIPDDFVC